jgi:cyclase
VIGPNGFHGRHPVVWSGPVTNWIAACDRLLALDGVHTVVPGHGPVTDLGAVAALKGYFEHLTVETRRCYDAGRTPVEAARAVKLGPYRGWSEPERLAVNINALYHDFGADVATDAVTLFTAMATLAQPEPGTP